MALMLMLTLTLTLTITTTTATFGVIHQTLPFKDSVKDLESVEEEDGSLVVYAVYDSAVYKLDGGSLDILAYTRYQKGGLLEFVYMGNQIGLVLTDIDSFLVLETDFLNQAGTIVVTLDSPPIALAMARPPLSPILLVVTTHATTTRFNFFTDPYNLVPDGELSLPEDQAFVAAVLVPSVHDMVYGADAFGNALFFSFAGAFVDLVPVPNTRAHVAPDSLVAYSLPDDKDAARIAWTAQSTLYVYDYTDTQPIGELPAPLLRGGVNGVTDGTSYFATHPWNATLTSTNLNLNQPPQALHGCNATVLTPVPSGVLTQCKGNAFGYPQYSLIQAGPVAPPPAPPPPPSPPFIPILPPAPETEGEHFRLIVGVGVVIVAVCIVAMVIPVIIMCRRSKWYTKRKHKKRARRRAARGAAASKKPHVPASRRVRTQGSRYYELKHGDTPGRPSRTRPPVPFTSPNSFPEYGSTLTGGIQAGPGGHSPAAPLMASHEYAGYGGSGYSMYDAYYGSTHDLPSPMDIPPTTSIRDSLPTVSWASSLPATASASGTDPE